MAVEAFELEIRDGISGPVKEIRGAITQLRAQLKGMNLDLLENQRRQIDLKAAGAKEEAKALGVEMAKQRIEARKLALEEKDLVQRQKELVESQRQTGESSGVMAGLVAGAVVKIGDAIMAAGKALVSFAVDLGKLAVESSTFRVHMTNAFAVFRGTAAEGQRTYEMVRGLSRLLPIPREQAMVHAQELLALNLQGENRTRNTIQAVANAQAALGDEAASKLKSIITQAQSTTAGGRFRGVFAPSREELLAIGVSYDDLSKTLATQLGKSTEETRQLLRYGRITAAQGIDALNATVTKGRIGEAARAAMYEPAKVFQSFRDNVFDLFDGFNLRPVMEELRLFADMFSKDSEAGKGLKAILDALFGGGGAGLREGVKRLRLAFIEIEISAVRMLILFAPMIRQVKALGESRTAMDALALSVKAIAFGFQTAATNILLTLNAIARVVEVIDQLRAKDVKGLGQSVGDGLREGITNSLGGIAGAGVAAAQAALGGIAKGLDAHSPSRKTMALGKDAADGFRIGAEAAGLPLAGGTLRVDAGRISPASASGAKGRSVTMGGITLNVSGVANAEALPAMLEPLFADLLERVAAEVA